MNDPWYETVAAAVPLSQGDVVLDCPVLGWQPDAGQDFAPGQTADLAKFAELTLRDVVVMTQACDLEHRKVSNVVLCPAVPLPLYRTGWETDARRRGQNPTEKAWRRALEDIAAGIIWNHSLLAGHGGSPATDLRVVFFTEVFTLPRGVIEAVLAARGAPRLRLRPPYREHLSQSFARFFMRVGLPQAVALP